MFKRYYDFTKFSKTKNFFETLTVSGQRRAILRDSLGKLKNPIFACVIMSQ